MARTEFLYKKDDILGRKIETFEPLRIAEGAEQATIIVDNIITGAQIIKAIKYYAEESGPKSHYFKYDTTNKNLLSNRLKALKTLNICTVLYTTKAITKIETECKKILNDSIQISVISGRAIDGDALFYSTEQIGEQDKILIKSLLTDKEAMRNLYNHLHCGTQSKKNIELSEDTINKTNLIARYQSLPKKCFDFLQLGLKFNKECQPFVRNS